MGITIGEISYTNIRPTFFYLDRQELEEKGCRFVPKVPSLLNKAMHANEVDVGGISSFAYAKHPQSFELLPDLSVSAEGAVGSIFLFAHQPIESLDGARIALTSSSWTSVHLLKVILSEFYGLQDITYETVDPDADAMLQHFDACLLIGDDAILTSWKKLDKVYTYDLGQLWYKHTGLPMTFAVFAVRKETTITESQLLKTFYKALLNSKRRSQQNGYQEMIRHIQQSFGGSLDFWTNYFQGLDYDFGKKEQRGLLYYYELLHKHGFIEHNIQHVTMWKAGYEVQSIS